MDSAACAIRYSSQGQRRGVHFLYYPSLKWANALDEFEQLPDKVQFYFKTSFDYWNDYRFNSDRFHGFDRSHKKGAYKDCFVFRNIQQKCRLYGFLSRPQFSGDVDLCILVLFCRKKENLTDETMLRRINQVRVRKDVVEAIESFRRELRRS